MFFYIFVEIMSYCFLFDVVIFPHVSVEIIGSVLTLGTMSGIVGGLLLEHCGVRKTGCVALSTTLSYIAILVTLHRPENFNGKLFPFFVVLFLVIGELGSHIFVQCLRSTHTARLQLRMRCHY